MLLLVLLRGCLLQAVLGLGMGDLDLGGVLQPWATRLVLQLLLWMLLWLTELRRAAAHDPDCSNMPSA